MRLLFVLALALLLPACASVPMAGADADARGKAFTPPPPDKAALYVYREGIFGAAVLLAVTVGPRALGSLAPDTWFRIDLDPGRYDVRCSGGENSESVIVQLASGETRFVEAAVRLGMFAPRCGIFEVSPEKGRTAVLAGRRAAEIAMDPIREFLEARTAPINAQ
jgi:hypothetical protein